MEEKDLTEKQRKWLEASRKIGLGRMTKSERLSLEGLYADLLPTEQQELAAYVEEIFGYDFDETPILERQETEYAAPSKGLRKALTTIHPSGKPELEQDDG